MGSGYSLSVAQVVDVIQKVLGTQKQVLCSHEDRLQEIPDVVADTTKIKHDLNWLPRYTLPQGIEEIVKHREVKAHG